MNMILKAQSNTREYYIPLENINEISKGYNDEKWIISLKYINSGLVVHDWWIIHVPQNGDLMSKDEPKDEPVVPWNYRKVKEGK
jgi:hypothetical protein